MKPLAGGTLFDPAGALLGVLISATAIFSLAYGWIGWEGHSVLSGMVLVVCLAGTALLLRRRISLVMQDYVFMLFVASLLCTFAINGLPPSVNESVLLCITI